MEARGAPAGAPWPPFLCKLPSGRGGAKRLHSSASRQSGEEGQNASIPLQAAKGAGKGQNASIPLQAAFGARKGKTPPFPCKPPKVARKGQNASIPLYASRQRWRGRGEKS